MPESAKVPGGRSPRIEWAELALPGGGLVELFRYLSPAGRPLGGAVNDPGKTHVCLEVDDLDGPLAKLHAAGIRSSHPAPVEIPRGDWRGFRDVYVYAPDEVVVELVERPAD